MAADATVDFPDFGDVPIKKSHFHSCAEVADTATAGVCHHLEQEETEIALALQDFAVHAWGASEGPALMAAAAWAGLKALARLDRVAGARIARGMLLNALAFYRDQANKNAKGREGERTATRGRETTR